jgi:hypothetical protein
LGPDLFYFHLLANSFRNGMNNAQQRTARLAIEE